ncbi:MAG: M24 family metallopeptidase [Candidatus Micrarchaeota archaeon]
MLLLYRGEEFDANFFYHSGADIDHGFFLEDDGKRTLFVSRMNEALARASFKGKVVAFDDAVKTLSPHIAKKEVGFDGASMSARMAGKLGRLCRLEDRSEELLRSRAEKRPGEVSAIRKAVSLTKDIFDSLDLSAAKTEDDIKAQLMRLTFERGAEPAFDPIVATGKNTAYPHYRSGRKRLGGLVLVDYGVRHNHYCSDLTRCFILDGDQKKKRQYEELQNVCFSLVDSLPNCPSGAELSKLSAKLMKWAGFPKLIHAIGHGIGLDVHESPSLGMKSKDSLAGCTMAIEPAFYLKSYGMRYEETVYFDGKKARIL